MKDWLEEDAERFYMMFKSAELDNEGEILVEDAEAKLDDAHDALEKAEAYLCRKLQNDTQVYRNTTKG